MNFEQRAAARELEGEPLALDPGRMGRLFAGGWRVARPRNTVAQLDRRGAVAILPVHGIVTPRATWVTETFGGVPLDRIRDSVRSLGAMGGVKTIVLAIDSPGGSVYGVEETAAEIRKVAEAGTRVVAAADSLAASAAYWLGAAADEFVVTPSGEVGSIGVYLMHFDWSKAMGAAGVNVTVVRAGKHKAEGHAYAPLGEDAEAHVQSLIDDYYGAFVRDVAAGRGTSAAKVLDGFGQGRTFTAQRALERGMVDRVATLDQVVDEAQAGAPSSGRRRASAPAVADPLLGYRPVAADRWARFMAGASQPEREDVRRVAIHEAGHAVVSLVEGAGLLGVGLELLDGERFAGGSCISHKVARRADVVTAAGIATEIEHGYRGGGGADDRKRIEESAYATGKVVNVPRSIATARRIVAPYRTEVKALASLLEARGWVDGAKAARILDIEV